MESCREIRTDVGQVINHKVQGDSMEEVRTSLRRMNCGMKFGPDDMPLEELQC